ncbi:MAG: T9SS type A sorting domain-containing protein [Bacteroidetes bacterium]|nr:T9SS type A sorting domain-containing protein [Bacteroidota bacterium]
MKKLLLFSFLIIIVNVTVYPQTTVITHGFNVGTGSPINEWMLEMANAIRNRVGDAVVRVYNPTSGSFDYRVGSGTQTILLFDWTEPSNDMQKGYTEDAGSSLFTALLKGKLQGDFNLDLLHFIGHSRGTVVNSEAVERLLVAGYPVEQVTSLDAHDWGGANFFTDYDCNPESWISGVEGWEGINWSDSYWQDATIDLSGRAVEGTYSTYLGTVGHSGVHDWYYQTILDTARHEGYYYSLNGGGSNNRPLETGIKKLPVFTFNNDGIMNGNFERGSHIYSSIPGWWYHGGGGEASIDNTYLNLNSSGSGKMHNRFYIPPNAVRLQFDYSIYTEDNTETAPNIDELLVLLNGNSLINPIYMSKHMDDWHTKTIFIDNLRNSVQTIEFRLLDEIGGEDNINSEVWIDNVKMIIDPFLSINESTYGGFNNSFEVSVYPNPFSDEATIYYTLNDDDFVTIKIYNVLGKEIATLADNIYTTNGNHEVSFTGTNLNAGIYFARIAVGQETQDKKIVLVK